jgi:hypothetical protein
MTVVFNDVDAFLEELEKDLEDIDRKVVRSVFEFAPIHAVGIHRVSLVATARVKGEIVSLRKYVGDRWGNDMPSDDEVEARGHELGGRISKFCESHELELRSGRYE